MIRCVLVAALAALGACHPLLMAETSAPPGRAAQLDAVDGFWGTKSYRASLSQGVALAISCSYGRPCGALVATSDDPKIAEVRPASFSARPDGYRRNQQPSAVIIVGKAPGTTTVRLRSKDGGRDVRVTVVEPPAQPAVAKAAR